MEAFGYFTALLGCLLIPGWVFLSNPRRETNQIFAMVGLSGVVYHGFAWWALGVPPDGKRLQLMRMAYVGSFLLLPLVVRFPRAFLGEGRVPGSRRLEALSWVISLGFVLVALTGGFLFRIDEQGRALGGWMVILWTVLVGAAFLWFAWILRHAYIVSPTPMTRNRILYLVLGAVLFAVPAAFDLLYRMGVRHPLPFPLAPMGAVLFLSCVAVAIVKHKLMDIEVVIHRGLVLSLLAPSLAFSFVILGELSEALLAGHLPPDSPYPNILAALGVACLLGPISALLSRLVENFVIGEYRVAPRLASFRRLPYMIGAGDLEGLRGLKTELEEIIRKIEEREE